MPASKRRPARGRGKTIVAWGVFSRWGHVFWIGGQFGGLVPMIFERRYEARERAKPGETVRRVRITAEQPRGRK